MRRESGQKGEAAATVPLCHSLSSSPLSTCSHTLPLSLSLPLSNTEYKRSNKRSVRTREDLRDVLRPAVVDHHQPDERVAESGNDHFHFGRDTNWLVAVAVAPGGDLRGEHIRRRKTER